MAKNKIEIEVKVDDKGTMKKMSLESKKAGDNLDTAGKSARTFDRNMKGASQQSANGTKNFSKMAQGMGGLVAIYATLAAQVFAVTAAFQFFKNVGDLRVLQDSQVAYASSTGIALRSITNDIRAASDGLLTFQESSKAAAIGVSSGLSGKQLVDLAKGASAVSKTLGRDVSDSFDRLVRGVTKAEPELLDELGITLRLEDAKTKYAASIGKTVSALTLLEQKQAVAAEVQAQLESKFISTSEAIDVQDNAIKKLGTAFDDVFNKFSSLISGPVESIASFFTENINALIGVLLFFSATVIKSLLPSLDSFTQKAEESASKAAAAFKETDEAFKSLKSNMTVQSALANVEVKEGSGAARLKAGEQINKKQAAGLLRYAKLEKGVYTQLTNYQKTVYKKALKEILGQQETATEKLKRMWYGLGTSMERQAKRVERRWKQAMVGITKAATKAGKAVDLAFKATGIIAVVGIVLGLLKELGEYIGLIKDAPTVLKDFSTEVERNRGSLESLRTEFAKLDIATQAHIDKIQEINKLDAPTPTITAYKTLGNAFGKVLPELQTYVELREQATSLEKQATEAMGLLDAGRYGIFTDDPAYQEGLEDAAKSAKELAEVLERATKVSGVGSIFDNGALHTFIQNLKNGFFISNDLLDSVAQIASDMQLLAATASTFEESFNNSNKQLGSFLAGLSQYKTATSDLLATTIKEIELLGTRFESFDALGNGQALGSTAEFNDQRKVLIERLAITSLINEKETKAKNEQLTLDRKLALQQKSATTLVKARLSAEHKISVVTSQYKDKIAELATLQSQGIGREDAKVQILEQQTAQLLEQLDILKEQEQDFYRLGMAAKQGLEDNLQGTLTSIIKGEQSSLKEAAGELLLGVGDAVANELSNIMTERIMGFIFKEKEDPAVTMQNSITTATTEAAIKWQQTLEAAALKFDEVFKNAGKEYIKPVLTTEEGILKTEGTKSLSVNPETLIAEKIPLEKIAPLGTKDDPLYVVPITEDLGLDKLLPKTGVDSIMEDTKKSKGTKVEKSDIKVGEGIQEGLTSALNKEGQDFIGSFKQSFVDGGDLLGGSLSSIFSSLGSSLLGSIGSLLGGSTGGSGISSLLGLFFAKGGYAPGGFRAFADGGMVTKPTLGLVGEGKMNEAIVPLPNGRSIPVDMKGAGQNNNVVVNVSVDNQGNGKTTTESQSGADAGNLGQAIARAVQQELQNQKRSGGILNPYGVS